MASYYMCLKASFRSYVLTKIGWRVISCFYRILDTQKWANQFFRVVIPRNVSQYKLRTKQKSMEILKIETTDPPPKKKIPQVEVFVISS